MPQALDGIRILDLTRLLPGGVCTMMLVDMGAEVIKVEDPNGGDYARWMPPLLNGLGAFFRASNRGKKSLILNLKEAEGQEIFYRLVQSADVLIEGFRPGVTSRLNIDYARLRKINPRLVYCSLSGWGQDGPYMEVSGHDLTYLARIGLQGAQENPQPLGGQVADVGGAYVAVMGILAALLKRTRTGEGDYIDVALSESALPFAMYAWVESQFADTTGGKGMLTGGAAFYRVYRSADNQPLALGAIEPKFWSNFCMAVNKPEWINDYTDATRQASLRAELESLFASKSADEWEAILGEVDCCFARIIPPQELIDEPQVKARGMVGIDADGVPYMRSPVRFREDHVQIDPAPTYGGHTLAVLASLGYSQAELDNFTRAGIIQSSE